MGQVIASISQTQIALQRIDRFLSTPIAAGHVRSKSTLGVRTCVLHCMHTHADALALQHKNMKNADPC